MRIILLNGPPRSGKSTAARALGQNTFDSLVTGFSYPLKQFVHGIYLGKKGFDLDPDFFDDVKGEPQEILDGMSWRQAYIHYSENVIKPLHGGGWFGEQLLRDAKESGCRTLIVPDSGFRGEAEVLVQSAGAKNVVLLRMFREGCNFNNDSRGYIDLTDLGVAVRDIANTRTLADLEFDVQDAVDSVWGFRTARLKTLLNDT